MTRERVQRWGDIVNLWRGLSYRNWALRYHASVKDTALGGPLHAGAAPRAGRGRDLGEPLAGDRPGSVEGISDPRVLARLALLLMAVLYTVFR